MMEKRKMVDSGFYLSIFSNINARIFTQNTILDLTVQLQRPKEFIQVVGGAKGHTVLIQLE